MNAKGILDQLLQQGSSLANTAKEKSGGLNSFAGGAVTGGALGLLLGNKKGRKIGGKVLKYGGLAAVGVLAYKAYSSHQQNKQGRVEHEPQTIDRLPAAQAQAHASPILRAVIGAAKADGHIDAREQQLIQEEFAKLSTNPADQQWLQAEIAKPLDPSDIARAATCTEIAAEMYLASVFVVDSQNFMERSYLQELARQLNLEPGLQAELDQQAQTALAQAG
ncbi:tellurite resistance TerB family protein [Aliidiomarina celeris]|uniref:tellurite resistance TerB family protein n=1 Tax=Aliidiomarina celeris TaxID=2249428 RepID=UPI000DEBDC06|nr:tellurite resistance TerB family protein [Aliidiomarina celeris]